MNLNSPPSHFPMHQITHENDHELYHLQDRSSSSSSSLSCRFFFDPSQDHHTAFYDHHRQLFQPNHVPDENYKVDHSGVGLGVWKKEDEHEHEHEGGNPMKWMSSKMRVMQKMKKTEYHHDQKMQASSSDLSSNSSSYNNNNNSPIRVCSDCNTTKTPLWRSGPKGPKSLCNACGIRQRKARRAMAAAAAAAAASSSDHSPTTTKIKLQHKGKLGKNGHASHFKKRCRTAVAATSGAASDGKKQLGFEDFLINLSNNLAFHRVFPDDVKDAAILLMALSSGLVNG